MCETADRLSQRAKDAKFLWRMAILNHDPWLEHYAAQALSEHRESCEDCQKETTK